MNQEDGYNDRVAAAARLVLMDYAASIDAKEARQGKVKVRALPAADLSEVKNALLVFEHQMPVHLRGSLYYEGGDLVYTGVDISNDYSYRHLPYKNTAVGLAQAIANAGVNFPGSASCLERMQL